MADSIVPARLRLILGRATSLGSHAASATLREFVLPELNISSDVQPPGDTFCLPLFRQAWWQFIFRYDQLTGEHGGHLAWLILYISMTQTPGVTSA